MPSVQLKVGWVLRSRAVWWCLAVATGLTAVGCASDAAPTYGGGGATDGGDSSADGLPGDGAGEGDDVGPSGVDGVANGGDDGEGSGAGKGLAAPYEPCESAQDCASNYCVQTWEGKVCAPTCEEGCNDGWLCTQDLASLPDVVFVCVPAHPTLCTPCGTDADCQGAGVGSASCVEYGPDGSFCAGDCSVTACPSGFVCTDLPSEGGSMQQCLFSEGICPCPPAAVDVGASTACTVENAEGVCEGERHCTHDGLSPCSAPTPAAEQCNGKDDDCDGGVDEGWAGTPCTVDSELGSCPGMLQCAPDGTATCDATSPAQEVCNGADDDCDGATDEAGAQGCLVLYGDDDGDGWGTGQAQCLCSVQGSYVAKVAGDCDDQNTSIHPDALEVCNGVDDDCDGLVDEQGSSGCSPFSLDGDGDGWGQDGTAICLCGPQGAYAVAEEGDCDDGNAGVHPGAVEVCNFLDDDCDGATDPAGSPGCTVYFADVDQDTWGDTSDAKCLCGPDTPHTAINPGDCDDADAFAHPAMAESCNGKDDDCDELIDEGAAQGCTFYSLDADGDGWGVAGTIICACAPVGQATAEQVGDCDDSAQGVHPSAVEACNGIDDDCDGLVDEAGAEGCTWWFADADGDGYGQSALTACLCVAAGSFMATVGGDCNDGTAAISPEGTEVCNGFDDDCDGGIDEEGAGGCTGYHLDADGDGWGVAGDVACLCSPNTPYLAKKAPDCDDGNVAINPATAESCNGFDDDCDGSIDEEGASGCVGYAVDVDGDGFGVAGTTSCLCGASGTQTATEIGDCNDASAEVGPNVAETCNATDDDCDGGIDEGCALASTGWPTYKYDVRRTGHRPDVKGPATAAQAWTYALASGTSLQNSVALVADGIIAQGGTKLVKLSFSGALVWSAALPAVTFWRNSPTVREGGTILVAAGEQLRLYSPGGQLLWTAAFAGESITATPIVAEDGAIYVLSSAGLRKLDAAGQVVWTSPAPNTQTSPGHPAVSPNGRVHFATSNHSVYSVIPQTGQAAWVYTHPQGFDTDSSVAIAPNGDVYQGFGSTVARLGSDGAVLGTVNVGGDMDGDVALLWDAAAGASFVYASPNGASGLRRYTANLVHQWTYPLTKDGGANGVPVFDGDGDAYVGDDTGLFVCVKANGALEWSIATGSGQVKSAAAVGSGFVVFGDGNGALRFVGVVP